MALHRLLVPVMDANMERLLRLTKAQVMNANLILRTIIAGFYIVMELVVLVGTLIIGIITNACYSGIFPYQQLLSNY